MSERPGRLNLIQRAAKRFGNSDAEEPAAAQVIVNDTLVQDMDMPTLPDGGVPISAPVAEINRQTLSGQMSQKAARVAKLRFDELRRRGLITPGNLHSNIAFEFRAIKRKLLSAIRDKKSNAIKNGLVMVTSALPSEGKTFTALNLALALAAERDLHVLLVDADTIHPSIGELFDVPEGRGFTDLLNGNCSNVSEVIWSCADLENLNIIFAGQRDERMPEIISSKRTGALLEEISNRYKDRIVIFDTPPVLAAAEPASLAAHMHQVIMVVAAGQSNRNQIQTALEAVLPCRNVSLVFNKAPKWQQNITDYSYYYRNDRGSAV